MKKSTADKLNNVDEQIRQLEEQRKALRKTEREEKEKERNRRLCKRGGIVEKHIPDLVMLTDEQFDIFANKVLFTEQTKRIISEILTPQPATSRPAKPPKSDGDIDTGQLTTQGNES